MPLLLFVLCVLLLSPVASPALTSEREAELSPWNAALNFDYNAASVDFAERHAAAPEDARLALAHAGALLARQPRTTANVSAAREAVAGVLALPAERMAPDLHALALYLHARIAHDHSIPADLAAARAGYDELRQRHAGHPLADHAAVHLAIMTVRQTPGLETEAKIVRLTTWLESIEAPSARRELLYLLGRVFWDERRDAAAALPPLQAGRALGYESPARNGETDLLIADLAVRAGRPEVAVRHFRAFADAYPRDTRSNTARRLAAETEATLLSTSPAASR